MWCQNMLFEKSLKKNMPTVNSGLWQREQTFTLFIYFTLFITMYYFYSEEKKQFFMFLLIFWEREEGRKIQR